MLLVYEQKISFSLFLIVRSPVLHSRMFKLQRKVTLGRVGLVSRKNQEVHILVTAKARHYHKKATGNGCPYSSTMSIFCIYSCPCVSLCFRMDRRWHTIYTVCMDFQNSPEAWKQKDETISVLAFCKARFVACHFLMCFFLSNEML